MGNTRLILEKKKKLIFFYEQATDLERQIGENSDKLDQMQRSILDIEKELETIDHREVRGTEFE